MFEDGLGLGAFYLKKWIEERRSLVSIGPLFSYEDNCPHMKTLVDNKEKGTPAAVLGFRLGTRRNFVRIACSSWSFLDMSGKDAFFEPP